MNCSLLPATLLLVLATPALSAQQSGGISHHDHPLAAKPALDAEMTEHFKGIPLSDVQVKHLMEIRANHHRAIDALRADATSQLDPLMKAAIQKHMDAEHAEFKALLTVEQSMKFEENMKSHEGNVSATAQPELKGEMNHGMKDGVKDGAKHDMKGAATPPAPKKP